MTDQRSAFERLVAGATAEVPGGQVLVDQDDLRRMLAALVACTDLVKAKVDTLANSAAELTHARVALHDLTAKPEHRQRRSSGVLQPDRWLKTQ